MSRFGRKADGILEGAEGRSLTRIGHSRGAFVRSLFKAERTVEPSSILDFDRNPAFSVTPRLSCHGFRNNEVRLQLHALAYNLGNFLRTLALPDGVGHWSLTTLREKLIKIGAKVVRHGRYITFQMAEVAIPRTLFANILRLIDGLRLAPLPP